MQTALSLTTCFDQVEERNGNEEFKVWLEPLLEYDSKIELAKFVDSRRPGGKVTEYVELLKGSFNLGFRYRFDEGPDAVIRFPKPGHTDTVLRDEKVTNEVHVMEYLRKNTTIPIPRIHSWGLTAECPQQFGPFIIMDFVDGTDLSDIMMRPFESEQDEVVLDPDIDNAVLDKLYRQIADYMLQLSQLSFDRIGAISKEPDSNTWSVTKRPLTYHMNELVTAAGYPRHRLVTSTFDRTSDYLKSLADQHITHLETQRNLAGDPEIAQARYIARHRFAQLVSKYCLDETGPFIPFCDDLRPANMLVNPETLQITAVIDLEYTNAMPAQFSYNPPWWLLLVSPERWLDRSAIDEFLELYEPRMEQFLRAMEKVEDDSESASNQPTELRLSARMRDSWRTKRFWFDHAARKGFEVDNIYWAALHTGHGDDLDLLDEETRAGMKPFVERKMDQLKAYDEDCYVRYTLPNMTDNPDHSDDADHSDDTDRSDDAHHSDDAYHSDDADDSNDTGDADK